MRHGPGEKYNPGNKQFLVGHAVKTFIDVVAAGRDPDPLVMALAGLLKVEGKSQTEAAKDFRKFMAATSKAAAAWDESDGEAGISPRQASYERFGHYVELAERTYILKQKPTHTDTDAGEYLLSGHRGRGDPPPAVEADEDEEAAEA